MGSRIHRIVQFECQTLPARTSDSPSIRFGVRSWEVIIKKPLGQTQPPTLSKGGLTTGNESLPKIITNNTITSFFKVQSSTLRISNDNSFRLGIFYLKNVFIFSTGNGQPGNQHCANCIGTLWFPIVPTVSWHGAPVASLLFYLHTFSRDCLLQNAN